MRTLIPFLLVLAMIVPGAAVFAQEQQIEGGPQVLIDFSQLEGTQLDFSEYPGLLPQGVTDLTVDMSIENWMIELSSSSASVANRVLSYCKPVVSQQMNGEVLGARVRFPTAPFNAWGKIAPPFSIPFYEEAEGEGEEGGKFLNKGVLRNVGTIKSVSVRVAGRNFPYGLSLNLADEQAQRREVFMGYLDFDGWRTLTWENPNYVTDVKQRDLRKTPMYPQMMPSIKFDSFYIYRHGSQIGGDFVTYVKDVQMVYDLAVLRVERDINDEEVWGILQERKEAKRAAEIRRLAILQILRNKEKVKMRHAITETPQE
ncbi:MAG: flagellar filament outer layer protein FlaA [Spirochaetota bacterium]